MSYDHIRYELQDGYVHTWLTVGPQLIHVEDSIDLAEPVRRFEVLTQHASSAGFDLDFDTQPAEPSTVSEGQMTTGDYTGRWRTLHCLEDHFVDLSNATARGRLRAWAYTGLESAEPQSVTLVLTTTDLADVWVNGSHVHRQLRTDAGAASSNTPHVTGAFEVRLNAGINDIVVRFATVAPGPVALVLALKAARETTQAPGLNVVLPTLISPPARRQRLEAVFQSAFIKQYVFTRHDKVVVTWPPEDDPAMPSVESTSIAIRVQTPAARVYSEADRTGAAGEISDMGSTYRFPNGPLEALLMPRGQEYYEGNMRVTRAIPFWGLDNEPYMEIPAGTYPERRQAALLSAARSESNVYSEIAKMAIGWWSRLELPLIVGTARRVQEQGANADRTELLGLIGMLARFGDDASFPAELQKPISDAILSAVHTTASTTALPPESRAFLSAACAILAGQLNPEATFPLSGQSGEWHRAEGEALALNWMRTRATQGFDAWGSDTVYAETILALAHLIDFADSDTVWEIASVLLDKLLFLIGAGSYKGVFGSTRGWTTTPAVLGGFLEATSPIGKLMWGTGVNNMHMAAPVSLALLENYELPVLLQAIATDSPDAIWSQEHHGAGGGVNTVTYKTPDYMLSAVQDYRPGGSGASEHVWQATLGPGATVFANHPVCAGISDAQRPNFWRGNGILPRVVQWQDALIALYNLPDDDWMGFTHAYFPIHAFDAHVLRDGWAFARKGDGYLALTASGGFDLLRTGHTADRELRSTGGKHVWLCQLGRAAIDGDFETFQARVLALPVAYTATDVAGAPGVRWTTLRGDELKLDWTGAFVKNGEPTPVTVDRHIDNAYCVTEFPADVLDIAYQGTVMRLKFEKP